MAMTYVVFWNQSGPSKAQAVRFVDKAAAEAYVNEALPGDTTAHVLTEAGDMPRDVFRRPTLVSIYNALTGNDTKDFHDWETGNERLWRTIVERATEATIIGEQQTQEGDQMPAKTTRTPKAAKAPAKPRTKREPKVQAPKKVATNGGAGRRALYPDDYVIVQVTKNPIKKTCEAYGRYACLRPGMTVGEAVHKKGVWRSDLNVWSKKWPHLKIVPANSAAAQKV